MNQNWKNYLLSINADASNDPLISFTQPLQSASSFLFPLTQFGILAVSGSDATQMLQGQFTCNVNEISSTKSGIGAFCNPKGRVITTFFISKLNDSYILLLPIELLEKVKNKLKMYILRSDVKIVDETDRFCMTGLVSTSLNTLLPKKEWETLTAEYLTCKIPSSLNRYIILAEATQTLSFWQKLLAEADCQPQSSSDWNQLDIAAGIPWLGTETSEEYIPQMLNIDKLGGVSFNKGCYTGQEVVARTHYLGKAKREMFLAEATIEVEPLPNTPVINSEEKKLGKVLNAFESNGVCKMLIVLPIEAGNEKELYLNSANKPKIRLLEL